MAYVITDECIACGSCEDECPVEAISTNTLSMLSFVLIAELVRINVRWKRLYPGRKNN